VAAGRCRPRAGEVLGAEHQPEPKGKQHEPDDQSVTAPTGEHLDAQRRTRDHARQGAGDQQARQWAAQPALAGEPQKPAPGSQRP